MTMPTTIHSQKRARQQGVTTQREMSYKLIDAERTRQIQKWGDDNNPDLFWLAILMEEVGEVAKALIENKPDEVLKETVQVAAVALAWLEHRVE